MCLNPCSHAIFVKQLSRVTRGDSYTIERKLFLLQRAGKGMFWVATLLVFYNLFMLPLLCLHIICIAKHHCKRLHLKKYWSYHLLLCGIYSHEYKQFYSMATGSVKQTEVEWVQTQKQLHPCKRLTLGAS